MFEVERYLRRGGRLQCSLFRPFGSSKPGVCGANNKVLLTWLPCFPILAPFKLKSHSILIHTNISPPKLKYYGRQELYSQSHKIQCKKALLVQDWVLRWNFHLLLSWVKQPYGWIISRKNTGIVGKLQNSALCSECNSSALGQAGVHWRLDPAWALMSLPSFADDHYHRIWGEG